MNASIAVSSASVVVDGWEEAPDSNGPTLAATAFTLLALTVAAVLATGSWESLSSRIRAQSPALGHVSSPSEFRPPASLTYYVVATEEQLALAQTLVAAEALERAQGIYLGSQEDAVLVRSIGSIEDEWLMQAEINEAVAAWTAQGHGVRIFDLRR